MMIHIEEPKEQPGKKGRPIIRLILDYDEAPPVEIEEIRSLLYDSALSLPRRVSQMEIVMLPNTEKGGE